MRAGSVVALQRLAGNRVTANALAGPVIQREVVHWALRNGKAIDRKTGHNLIGLLSQRSNKALQKLPPRQDRGALGSFEFGLGRDDQDRYCIVEGSGKAVNWSEPNTTKGVTPVAHSHPIEKRELVATYPLADVMSPGGGDDVATARQLVLPSIDDVIVANKLKQGQPTHHVYTPYRVRQVNKQWTVGANGKPLTFRISDMKSFIQVKGVDRYLSADLTALAGRKQIRTAETWSPVFGKTNRAVNFSRPNVDLEPW